MNRQILKIIGITFFVGLCSTGLVKGQADSSPYVINELFVETGVIFPQSTDFQDVYNTKSAFNWSGGIRFGTSNSRLLKWVKYGHYQSHIDTGLSANPEDEKGEPLRARRRQVAIGLLHPMEFAANRYLVVKLGISRNYISEGLTGLDSRTLGFIMSAGYMRRFSKYFTYYIDFSYDYAKTGTGSTRYFKDWGGFTISYGLSFNLAADETPTNL